MWSICRAMSGCYCCCHQSHKSGTQTAALPSPPFPVQLTAFASLLRGFQFCLVSGHQYILGGRPKSREGKCLFKHGPSGAPVRHIDAFRLGLTPNYEGVMSELVVERHKWKTLAQDHHFGAWSKGSSTRNRRNKKYKCVATKHLRQHSRKLC